MPRSIVVVVRALPRTQRPPPNLVALYVAVIEELDSHRKLVVCRDLYAILSARGCARPPGCAVPPGPRSVVLIALAFVAAPGAPPSLAFPDRPGPPSRRPPSGDVENCGWTGSETSPISRPSSSIQGDDTDVARCGRGFLGLDGRQTQAVEDLLDRKQIRDVGNDAEFAHTAATEEEIDAVDLVDKARPAAPHRLRFGRGCSSCGFGSLVPRVRLA